MSDNKKSIGLMIALLASVAFATLPRAASAEAPNDPSVGPGTVYVNPSSGSGSQTGATTSSSQDDQSEAADDSGESDHGDSGGEHDGGDHGGGGGGGGGSDD